jgi:hypothetical protein
MKDVVWICTELMYIRYSLVIASCCCCSLLLSTGLQCLAAMLIVRTFDCCSA